METEAAPGISHGSIMLRQDWERLLCQSNVMDPLWTSTSLHCIFLTSSVCASMCVCVGGVLKLCSLKGCPLWTQPSVLYLFFFSSCRIVFPYQRWAPCPQILLRWSTPTPPMFYTNTKLMLSSTLCDFHCSTTGQMHPPPTVMSFHARLKRSNMWHVLLAALISELHWLVHLEKLPHADSKVCKQSFYYIFWLVAAFTQMPNCVSVKEEVTQCFPPYCHNQLIIYCLQFFSIYICIEHKWPKEWKIMWGFLLSVHAPQLPTLPWHSANEDHPPLHLSTSRAGWCVKS